jgi:hypothetical protein
LSEDLWILDGDESTLATAEQTAPGDLIVRRSGDTVEVGRLTDDETPRIEWFGEVDGAPLPTTATSARPSGGRTAGRSPRLELDRLAGAGRGR